MISSPDACLCIGSDISVGEYIFMSSIEAKTQINEDVKNVDFNGLQIKICRYFELIFFCLIINSYEVT